MKNYQPALVLRLCDVYVEETDKKKKKHASDICMPTAWIRDFAEHSFFLSGRNIPQLKMTHENIKTGSSEC